MSVTDNAAIDNAGDLGHTRIWDPYGMTCFIMGNQILSEKKVRIEKCNAPDKNILILNAGHLEERSSC